MDPITGEFDTDGFNVDQGITMVDVQAGKALQVDANDKSNVLFAGQLLCLGLGGHEVINRIDKLIGREEFSVEQTQMALNHHSDNQQLSFSEY